MKKRMVNLLLVMVIALAMTGVVSANENSNMDYSKELYSLLNNK